MLLWTQHALKLFDLLELTLPRSPYSPQRTGVVGMQLKNNVYDKQQTSDLRWQFLKLGNKQMIAVINK